MLVSIVMNKPVIIAIKKAIFAKIEIKIRNPESNKSQTSFKFQIPLIIKPSLKNKTHSPRASSAAEYQRVQS